LSRKAWLLFVAMCVIWGLPYLLIRVSVHTVTPAFLVFMRTFIGACLLLPFAIWRRQLRAVLPFWLPLVAYTLVEIAIPWVLLSEAERTITSSLSGLLIAAVPLVGTVIARASGAQERLRRVQLVGLLVGLLGVSAVLGFDVGGMTVAAGLEMVVVIVCYAAGPQILARQLSHLPGLSVVACSLTLAAIAYLPIALIQRPDSWPPGKVVASIAILGVVCTAAGFIVFFQLIQQIGPVRATVITYVNPAVAVLLGVAVLHEHFTVGTAFGFALILCGSAFATRGRRSPKPELREPVPAIAEP
jgi:drug/metabolite transporter (DMT)-like permease